MPASEEHDRFNLGRFVQAQVATYAQALAELRAGRKRTHWMWFVFPQYHGLGFSSTSRFYAIQSLDEAQAYLAHPILGPRLHECANAVLRIEGQTAREILGSPDDLKLRSCATLFAAVLPPGSVFTGLLHKYYAGQPDPETLRLLRCSPAIDKIIERSSPPEPFTS